MALTLQVREDDWSTDSSRADHCERWLMDSYDVRDREREIFTARTFSTFLPSAVPLSYIARPHTLLYWNATVIRP